MTARVEAVPAADTSLNGFATLYERYFGADRGMAPGTILLSSVVLDNGWTDETPHHG